MDFITGLTLVVIIGGISGFIAVKTKLPSISTYILGGMLASIFIQVDSFILESTTLISFCISFLLFLLGVELGLPKFKEIRSTVVVGGIVQIFISVLLLKFILPGLGFSEFEALFLAVSLAVSSLMAITKVLNDIGQLETTASSIIITWLSLQGILGVSLFALLDNFAEGNSDLVSIIESLFKSGILIAAALLIGRNFIYKLLESLSRYAHKEFLVIVTLVFVLVYVFLSKQLGFPIVLTSFISGLMIADVVKKYELFEDIKPIKSIFYTLVFVTLGLLFSVEYLIANLPTVVLVLVIFTLVKFLATVSVSIFIKLHIRSAIEVALGLSQIGEFVILLAILAVVNQWIDPEFSQLVTTVTILSLLLSTVLIYKSDFVYERLRKYFQNKAPKFYRKYFMAPDPELEDKTNKRKDHIIIVGFGDVGRSIAAALSRFRFKLVVVEADPDLAKQAKAQGIFTINGNPISEEVLLQAGLPDAKVVVVTLPLEREVLDIVKKIEQINPELAIVIRVNTFAEKSELQKYTVIESEFEVALKMTEKLLKKLDKKDSPALKWLRDKGKIPKYELE